MFCNNASSRLVSQSSTRYSKGSCGFCDVTFQLRQRLEQKGRVDPQGCELDVGIAVVEGQETVALQKMNVPQHRSRQGKRLMLVPVPGRHRPNDALDGDRLVQVVDLECQQGP